MKRAIFFLTLLFPCAIIFAQDKALLEMLAQKGMLTNQEITSIAKESVAVMRDTAKSKSLQIFGLTQLQYQNIAVTSYNDSVSADGARTNSLAVKHVFLGMSADLGADWSLEVNLDLCSSAVSQAYFDYTYIRKKIDYGMLKGTLDLGYRKAMFGYEENLSAAKLMTIERSIATYYFTGGRNDRKLGFGGRYVGIFWNGEVTFLDGLNYGFSITNPYNCYPTGAPDNAGNSLNFFANIFYTKKFENFSFKTGLNFGYGSEANSISANKHGSILGLNPYFAFSLYDFNFWADFFYADVEYGKNLASENSQPIAVNVNFEYRFNIGEYGQIAPTFRYSYVDTDGRGILPSDGISAANNVAGFGAYHNVQSFFAGVSWYFIGDDFKLQVGYEFDQFNGTASNRHARQFADANVFRIQLQNRF